MRIPHIYGVDHFNSIMRIQFPYWLDLLTARKMRVGEDMIMLDWEKYISKFLQTQEEEFATSA
jgi:hypothetical protein